MRIDGKFVDAEGNQPDGQYVGVVTSNLDSLCTNGISGPFILASTMLRSHIPSAIFQRTCVGRTHANSTCLDMSRPCLSFS